MPSYAWMLVRVAATLVAAFLAARAVRLLVARFVHRIGGSVADTAPLLRVKRAQTLGGLLRAGASMGIWVIAMMVVLGQVGVDIGPLVAAAGVGGVALGFGAQTLVRDLIAGFFLLVENHYDVGDVVEAGGASGTVEEISLRTTVLRNLDGRRHVVPNGEIRVTSNLTKELSRYTFDIVVPYDTGLDQVIREVRRQDERMRQDPVLGPTIRRPVKVLGVQDYAEDGATLRAFVETVPGRQWRVGRELEARIRRSLAARGMAVAYPGVMRSAAARSAEPTDHPDSAA